VIYLIIVKLNIRIVIQKSKLYVINVKRRYIKFLEIIIIIKFAKIVLIKKILLKTVLINFKINMIIVKLNILMVIQM